MQEKSAFRLFGGPVEKKIERPAEGIPAHYQEGAGIGSSGPVMDFSRILERILTDEQTFNYLPGNIKAGLRKLYKMTQDPFKYASEESEATDGANAAVEVESPRAQLKALRETLTKAVSNKRLPKLVQTALLDAHKAVENELATIGEVGPAAPAAPAAPAPAPTPSRREVREEKKREDVIRRQTEKQDKGRLEDTSVDRLKKMLMGSQHYPKIYQRLPIEIRKEIDKLSLDPENVKYLSSQRMVFASRSVVERFLSAAAGPKFMVKMKDSMHAYELYDDKGANVYDLDKAAEAAEAVHEDDWKEVYNGREGISRDEWLEKQKR